MLKKDYEEARLAAEKRAQEEKEEEKRRKEEARLERARRIEEEKNSKKKKGAKKDVEPDRDGINKDDSREGLRAYARGRSYIPNRFGEVTPYTDPNELIRAELEAQASSKQKKKGAKKEEK